MTKKPVPAAGEQNAIRGYYAQYEFSASTLLRLMQSNELDALSVSDQAAGILDDLVIFSGQDLLAHQIKSQVFPKPFRFKTELIDHNLIANIAKSWRSLRTEYPSKNICIHYILPGYPSINDKKYLNNIGHSAQLFSYLTDPETEFNQDTLLSSEWEPFIRELIEASELKEEQFFEMFCLLKFYDQGEMIRRQITTLDSYAAKKARQIKHLLPDIIARNSTKKLWTEQDLINELNWNRVAGLRAQHNFPLNPDVQVNLTVEEELNKAIKEHRSGYISLVGPPGTGKSTTLQRAITTSPRYGVARYLAFLPDQRHGLGRAESTDFLNDLTIALNKLGFSRARFTEEDQLRDEFLKQLEEARDLYLKQNQKTLIVIDGLDHIQREENPQHSLLSILPPPKSIPDGVLFILGSQFLELDGLARSIIQQASATDRRIEMKPLPKLAIFDMAEKAELPKFVKKQALFEASKGHPLITRYYIEKLSKSQNEVEADHLLSSDELGDNVEQMYELVWEALAPDEEAKHVLALIARAENSISPEEIAIIVNDAAVEKVRKKAGFLLSGIKDGNWSIFHNSFRVFLGIETSKRFGRNDSAINQAFYSELADIAAKADNNSEQRWLELRSRSRAGDKQAVKRLATPELFRKQLEEFRPSSDIYVDLRLAYGAIEDKSELSKFVQLMMAEKEIDYRLEAISQLDLVQAYLAFEEQNHAFKIALADGSPNEGTYKLLDHLYKQGDVVRARTLFEEIEPTEYFFGQDKQQLHSSDLEPFYDWIERAHRFRSIENILEIVQDLPFDDLSLNEQRDPTDDLKFVLARGILYDAPSTNIDKLCTKIGINSQSKTTLLVHAAIYLNNIGDKQRVQLLLILLNEQLDRLNISNCRVCARLAFEHGKYELARDFLANVRVHASKKFRDYSYRERLEGLFASTFSVARLSEHLDVDVLFDPSEEDEFQNKVLEHIIHLGRIQGKLEKANVPLSISIKEEVLKTCLFLALADSGEEHHFHEPLAASSLAWLAKTLVRLAVLDSESTLQALEDQVEKLYLRGNNRISRFSPFRLTFAKEVYSFDGDQEKAIRRVRYLEEHIQFAHTTYEAVELRVELSIAIAEIGAIDQAKTELLLIHSDTFGYFLRAKKEPQYIFWNKAFERACHSTPAKVGEFTVHFAQFVLGLSDTEGRGTGYRIAYDLLKNATAAPEQCAGTISRLIETGLINWADIVTSVLHGIVLLRPDLARQCCILYCRLVIPFAGEQAHDAIAPIYQRLPESIKSDAVSDFIQCAQLYADTSSEYGLLFHLQKTVLPPNNTLNDALERSDNELTNIRDEGTEKHRTSPSPSESEKKLEKFQSLSELILKSDGIKGYGGKGVDYLYARRATKLLATASQDELLAFLDQRSIILEDTKFVITAASRLIDLGITQKADELYLLAERLANNGSWSDWLGGEKIAFQKLRKKREGDASQEKGFGLIIDDFAHGRTTASMVLPDLDEMFDLVAPNAAWDEIWLNVQDHLSMYREYAAAEPVDIIQDVSSEEELIGYIFRIGFSQLSFVLIDQLRDSLLKIAVQPDSLILFDVIAGMLVRDETFHREISAILWKLIDEENCKDVLIKYAEQLCLADDVVVTNVARNILYHFDIEFDTPSQELPAFYQFAVLGDKYAENFELPAGIDPRSKFWIDDPFYWTNILGREIKLISRASNIEVEAIRRRCAEFMRKAGGEEAFGPSAEKQLEVNLKNLDLQFTYARLIPHFAIKSLGKVIEELSRSNHIDPRILPVIWSDIGGAHFARYKIPIKPRPDWLIPASLPKMDHWKIDANVWLQRGSDYSFIPFTTKWFVLAEHTEFTFVGSQKKRSTIRTSLPNNEWECPPDYNLFGLPQIINLENIGIMVREHDKTILCTLIDQIYGDLREAILTFNNKVLNELGWKRSKICPFDIYSNEGELVATTLIWKDGIGYPEHSSMERSGHGHIVLISHIARTILEEHFGKLEIGTRVIQQYDSRDGDKEQVLFNL